MAETVWLLVATAEASSPRRSRGARDRPPSLVRRGARRRFGGRLGGIGSASSVESRSRGVADEILGIGYGSSFDVADLDRQPARARLRAVDVQRRVRRGAGGDSRDRCRQRARGRPRIRRRTASSSATRRSVA